MASDPLATWPFDRWQQIFEEAINWGLLSPDPDLSSYLRIQPILPYFLRTRLYVPEQTETRAAIETAFRELYDQVGNELYDLLRSKEPQERQRGQVLVSREYENLAMALHLALMAHVSAYVPYMTLSSYIDVTQDHQRGLELGQRVLKGLEAYPIEHRTVSLGAEIVGVISTIAKRYLLLKQYAEAEVFYQKEFSLWLENRYSDANVVRKKRAEMCHHLGTVAQEQRQWQRAEDYYQQALHIYIDFNDWHAQAGTLHNLGALFQAQRQWQQAEGYLRQALQIKIDFNDRHAQADTLQGLGVVAQAQRQWQQAKHYYQQALQIEIDFNDHHAQAGTLQGLGSVAENQGQWQQAEDYYQQALQIYISLNDRYGQARILTTGLSKVAEQQGRWQQAEHYYQRALNIYIDFNDRHDQAGTLYRLGTVLQMQGNLQHDDDYYSSPLKKYEIDMKIQERLQQAEDHYRQALQIWIDCNDQHAQIAPIHQLGKLAQGQGQWQQAEAHYQQALQICINSRDRHAQAFPLHQLGELAQEQEQWDKAREQFLQALTIFVEYDDWAYGSTVAGSLVRLWKKRADTSILPAIASIFNIAPDETEKLLQEMERRWMREVKRQS